MIEVERRTPDHIALPNGSSLEIAANVCDSYFCITNGRLERLRRADILYPSRHEIYAHTIKERTGSEFREIEIPVDEKRYRTMMDDFAARYGAPTIVSGYRQQHRLEKFAICIDEIDNLGPWTEVEQLVRNQREIDKSVSRIMKFLADLGIPESRIFNLTYPEMIARV